MSYFSPFVKMWGIVVSDTSDNEGGNMDLKEHLFSLRQKSGQSLQAVADAVGLSKAHVWELEKGLSKNPSFELVRKLATHYGVSIDVLTGTAPAPAQAEVQATQIYRDLGKLSDRDRALITTMVQSMLPKESAES